MRENTETQLMKLPSASEPVSPINTEALFVLNIRNAAIAPHIEKGTANQPVPAAASRAPIQKR